MIAPLVDASLLVVTGPTAAGKTDFALELARAFDGELVGADSVQVYRGFDIGSAKPTPEELGGIPHHLLDVVEPDEPIDAMSYARLADQAIASIVDHDRVPILVGGTGLWLRALLRGLVELPPPDAELRAHLDREVRELGAPALHQRLTRIDPQAAGAIHPNDALRIVRALEVHEQTGQALGELRRIHALGSPRYRALVFALDRPRDELYRRIDARIDDMLTRGWLEETRHLLERYGPEIRGLGAVGYREWALHLLERVPFELSLARVRKATRVYTRRQRTWIGSTLDVHFRGTPDDARSPDSRMMIHRFLNR